MKTVTLPMEEYEELLRDQEDKKRLMEELEADAKERGFFVQLMNHFYDRKNSYGYDHICDSIPEKNTLKIISKDEVLAKAQSEIDRLTAVSEDLAEKLFVLKKAYDTLISRGFFARLLNKEN